MAFNYETFCGLPNYYFWPLDTLWAYRDSALYRAIERSKAANVHGPNECQRKIFSVVFLANSLAKGTSSAPALRVLMHWGETTNCIFFY